MTDPRLFRLRVSYRKTGRLALLSHLEVARALERIVRRAGLPYGVSHGFSPHMRIAFGSALPVGVGSLEEYYDLFLTEYRKPATVLELLQEASPKDLCPQACSYVEPKASAVSVAFPFSVYRALLSQPLGVVRVPEAITVKRKKKEKTLRVADYLVGHVQSFANEDGTGVVGFALESKATGSLRPDVFLANCLELNSTAQESSRRPETISLTRVGQYETLTAVSNVF